MLRLTVLLAGDVISQASLAPSPLVLGSAEECDIFVADSAVSRRHASVERVGEAVWLADLGSKNGLWFGGRRVERLELKPGMQVQFGRAVLRLEDLPEEDTSSALSFAHVGPVWSASDRAARGSLDEFRTSSLKFSAEPEFAAVLSLVQDLSSTPAAWQEVRRHESLLRLRTALGAEGIWCARLTADGESMVVANGRQPDEAERRAATRVVSSSAAAAAPLQSVDRTLTFKGASDLFVLAVFPASSIESGLTRALFEWGARHLLEALSPAPPATPRGPARRSLQLPPRWVLGSSASSQRLREAIASAIEHRGPVLVLGLPGVGKEGVIRTLHASRPRSAGQPLVTVSMAEVQPEIADSILFGIAAGVATGVAANIGRFREAGHGTLFLDEIGEADLRTQGKLLRVLEEREVQPVGTGRPVKVEAHVVAATNRDLEGMVREGGFRRDLLSRLSGAIVRVPSLSERIDDLPELLSVLVADLSQQYGRRIAGISHGALRMLQEYHWPLNIRELRQAVDAAVRQCPSGGQLESRNFLSLGVREPQPEPAVPGVAAAQSTASRLRDRRRHELRAQIAQALETTGGNVTRAAQLLGISRDTLYRTRSTGT